MFRMNKALNKANLPGRQVYVDKLPPTADELSVAAFFSRVMSSFGDGPGDAVVSVCYINSEKTSAFVELRSAKDANNAVAILDGIVFEGEPLQVRRANDFLVPQADEDEGLFVFVDGLPRELSKGEVGNLLQNFGNIRGLEWDKPTGCALCFYSEKARAEKACAVLNRLKNPAVTVPIGNKLILTKAVHPDHLRSNTACKAIKKDMRMDYGNHLRLVEIPRPSQSGEMSPEVGDVYLEFPSPNTALEAWNGLQGEKWLTKIPRTCKWQ